MDKNDLIAIWEWIKARAAERTTWDGIVLIVICLLVLAASPFIKWIAWAGVVYGLWTVWVREGHRLRDRSR